MILFTQSKMLIISLNYECFTRNKIVWLSPERTGTSITKKIFESYNFFSITKKNDYKLVDLRKTNQSYDNQVLNDYADFLKITNIRNPYDRVFACYQKFYLEKPILKNNTEFKDKILRLGK